MRQSKRVRFSTYKGIINEHPGCWEAWYKLGWLQNCTGDINDALKSFRHAVDVATENGESKDPNVCWIYLQLGNIWTKKGEIATATDCLKSAIESSPSHTISHITLCKINMMQGEFSDAEQNFTTAIGLNPKLAKEVFGTETFDEYFNNFKIQPDAAGARSRNSGAVGGISTEKRHKSPVTGNTRGSGNIETVSRTSTDQGYQSPDPGRAGSGSRYDTGTSSSVDPLSEYNRVYYGRSDGRSKVRNHEVDSGSSRDRNQSSGVAGRGGRSGGGGSGSSSDDDDDFNGKDVNQIWKKMQKESPCIKMYKYHKYVQSKCRQYWYSRDTAGHGHRDHGYAAFKRYEDTGSRLRFKDSLDQNMRPMTNKHESKAGTYINKNDMIGVK